MANERGDTDTGSRSDTGINKYRIYLILGIFATVTGLGSEAVKIKHSLIAIMIQQDYSAIVVYNTASNVGYHMVDLYLYLYLAWVPLMMGMILYNTDTARHKIRLRSGRRVEAALILFAVCLIVLSMIGWTQPILTVALGTMIAYNVLLDRQDSKRLSHIQKWQAGIGVTMCMAAFTEAAFHVFQITGMWQVMLVISMILVLVTASLTYHSK